MNQANGAGGPVSVTVHHANRAQALEGGEAKTKVTGPDGAVTEYVFQRTGLPSELILSGYGASNAVSIYEYNGDDLTKKVTEPEGNSEEYVYDEQNSNLRSRGNLLSIKRHPGPRGGPDIPPATFTYDARYNLPAGAQTDFNGNTITYELTADGRDIKSIAHGSTATETFTYNQFGQLTHHTTVEGIELESVYDELTGFEVAEKRGGITTINSYSGPAGNRGLPTSIILPRGEPISQVFDERGQLITVTRGAAVDKRSYDENGNLVRAATKVAAGEELVARRKFSQIGFLEEVTLEQVDVDGTPQDLTTTFEPDAAKRIKRIIFPGGETRTHEFDHLGRIIQVALDDYVQNHSYDLNGNQLTVARGGSTNTFAYDGYDRPILITEPAAEETEQTLLTYYGNGETRSAVVRQPTFGTVREVHFDEIDALGRARVVRVESDGSAVVTRFDYDPLQRVNTITSPRQEVTTIRYDSAGRSVSVTNSLQGVVFVHDDNDNLEEVVSIEEANSYTTSFSYDGLDHQLTHSDEIGSLFTFTPRIDGVAESLRDARGNTTMHAFTVLGEQKSVMRPNGVGFQYQFGEHRAISAIHDLANKGRSYFYDSDFRLNRIVYRNGSETRYEGFDGRNNPTNIIIPGGRIMAQYDLQGRLLRQSITYNGVRGESFEYDALNRVRRATYNEDSATYVYDKLGPVREARFIDRGAAYAVHYEIYADGARKAITYPSGVEINEDRPANGRLQSVVPDVGEPIVQNVQYEGADLVRQRTLGPEIMLEKRLYDARKRTLARRYERISDGNILAEVRYAYDPTDNIVARQFIHRSGRGDFFAYDAGNRLVRADIGVRPGIESAVPRTLSGFSIPAEATGPFAPGFFARTYAYDGGGRDLLQHTHDINPDGFPVTGFATNFADTDDLLFAREIDGFNRGNPDPLGNAARTILHIRKPGSSAPQPVEATLTYNGLSQLIKIDRTDGITIEYDYQHDGLRHYRKVSQTNAVLSETAFVYDGDLLIEEWDRTGGANLLLARYFYDDGDVPVAGEFRDSSGNTNRYYFLSDAQGSVIAVADGAGEVVERISYDPWGQPLIELSDRAPPRIARILSIGGDLIIEFTEPVLPPLPDTSAASSLIASFGSPTNAIVVESAGVAIQGTLSYVESLSGHSFGTVLRFHPVSPLSGSYAVVSRAGAMVDVWNNPVIGETNNITFDSTDGAVLLVAAAPGSSAARRVARSTIDSPFLFHGQYFEYDAGLVYMRARFYDPYTGQFLQSDPEGYEDSVNLYAGFGHNPVTYRDPTGAGWIKSALSAVWKGRGAVKRGAMLRGTAKTVAPATIASSGMRTGRQNVSRRIENFLEEYKARQLRRLSGDTARMRERVMRNIGKSAAAREASKFGIKGERVVRSAGKGNIKFVGRFDHPRVMGETKPFGEVSIRRGLSTAKTLEVLIHEGVHSFWSPARNAFLAQIRADIRMGMYKNSFFMQWAEEALAQSTALVRTRHLTGMSAPRGLWEGLNFPVTHGYKVGNIPITRTLVITEAAAAGTALGGTYYLGDRAVDQMIEEYFEDEREE